MRVALMTILAALTVAAQDTPKKTGSANFYSAQKESQLGASLAVEVRRQSTPIDSAVVRDFVNRIGARLAAQIPAAPFPYTFEVIAGDLSNATHEPLSIPGGYIFVPAKLILTANDEAEFAGMLAHSMAHVSERHATREATRGQIANTATIPMIFMGGWTGYGSRQSNVLIPVAMLQFYRSAETEADTLAIATAARAGYDPSALPSYIGRVGPAEPGTVARVFAPFPTPEERVSRMQTAIQALPAQTYATPDAAVFAGIQAEVRRLMPIADNPQLRRVASLKKH